MFTRVATVGTSVKSSVPALRKCPTTVDTTNSSTSLFISNHVDQDARVDSAIVYEITLIINSSVVGCFRKFGVVGCVPYGTQGFLSSLVESSGLFSNKMDRVPSNVSLDT